MPIPKMPEEARRSKFVGCRLTPRQHEVLSRAASVEGLTVGEFVTRDVHRLVVQCEMDERDEGIPPDDMFPPLSRAELVESLQVQLRHIIAELALLADGEVHLGAVS